MDHYPYTISYYLTDRGRKSFKEWLDGLKDIVARQKVRIRLDRVRLGNLGKNRSVGEGVYELKLWTGISGLLRPGEGNGRPAFAGRRQIVPEKGHRTSQDFLARLQEEKQR